MTYLKHESQSTNSVDLNISVAEKFQLLVTVAFMYCDAYMRLRPWTELASIQSLACRNQAMK